MGQAYFLQSVCTHNFWSLFFSMFRLAWLLPHSVKDMWQGWPGSLVGKGNKKAWKMVPLFACFDESKKSRTGGIFMA